MNEYIKKYEKSSILESILMVILSIFLILEPIKTLTTVLWIFGIVMTVLGIVSVVSYFSLEKDYKLFSLSFIEGLLQMIAGLLIIFKAESLTTVLPVLIGIWIIVKNMIRLQLAMNLSTIPESKWGLLFLVAILSILLGIIIIIDPFTSVLTITMIAGISLLITEVCNLIESIYILIKIK